MSNSVPQNLSVLLLCFALGLSLACGGSSVSGAIQPSVTVNIASAPAAIGAGANWQYSATVSGNSNQSVRWTATAGNIDSNTGLYIAPATVPNPAKVTISAASVAASSAVGTTTVTVQANDPLGSAQGSSITCPNFGGGVSGSSACYQVNLTCDGIADFSGYLKVNQPAGTPLGTVIFGTGKGGSGLYDSESDFGSGGPNVVQGILNAGFTTVQVSFGAPFNLQTPNGWLTGPGGVRRLACRYATLAQWVFQNIHNSSTTAPLCATGNSGGAGAIAYAVTDYGMNSIFSMIEETSGPPMARLDEACVPASNAACQTKPFTCNNGDPVENLATCYSLSEAAIVDTAYSQPVCSNAINGTAAPNGLLLSDSILGGITPPSFPKTRVNILFGGQDTSSAVEQGLVWGGSLTGANKTQACVTDAPHAIPSVLDGATQIVTDIQNLCKVQ